MYINKPKVIMRARVNMNGTTLPYPQEIINFDTVTVGNTSLLKESMTVLLGSAPDKNDYGTLRYRYMDPDFPLVQMHVARYSRGIGIGEANIVDNSYITVLEEYRVWAKIPVFAGAAMWKDTDIGSELNNGKPEPVPNGGPGAAGDINPATGLLQVEFNAESFVFDLAASPPISVPNNFRWEWSAGATLVGGSNTTSRVVLNFAPGFHYVYLHVDNLGVYHTGTQKIPIFARDPANDLSTTQFNIVSHLHDQIGQELTIEMYKDFPREQYYDGFLMMMWDDAVAYFPEFRYQMQFIGWHQADDIAIRAEPTATTNTTRLTFFDAGKRLTMLPGFTVVMKYATTVGVDWSLTLWGNMLYYIWFMLHMHSTVLEVADFFDYTHSLSIFKFAILGSDKQNLNAQIQDLGGRLSPSYRMSCNRLGQLKMVPDLNIMRVVDRPNNLDDIMDTLDDSRWTSITWAYSHQSTIGIIQTKSLISTNDFIIVDGREELEVISCVAPGTEHGQGEQFMEVGERISLGQSNLNDEEGNRFAKLNAKFQPFTIVAPRDLVSQWVDPAEAKWLKLTFSDANSPIREAIGFDEVRGIVTEMTTEYTYESTGVTRDVSIHWEMETSGFPANTVILWPDVPEEGTV